MDFFKSNCTRVEARDLDDCLGMLDSDQDCSRVVGMYTFDFY